MMLSRALGHLRREEPEQALGALLEAWRAERSPRIADLVELLSERLTTQRAPIAAGAESSSAAWLGVEANVDPADLGRLLAAPWPSRLEDATVRVARLAARPDDPRVAMSLARLIELTPYSDKSARALYRKALAAVTRIGDLRTVPVLEKLIARPKTVPDYRKALAPKHELATRMRVAFPAQAPAVRDLVTLELLEAHFTAARAGRQRRLDADRDLLAAIHDNPEDDAPRQVYADALLERGDPRGEFMALQLAQAAGRFTEEMAKRERALFAAHSEEWSGQLRDWIHRDGGRLFERGFLAYGVLMAGPDEQERAFSASEWATVNGLIVPDEKVMPGVCVATTLRGLRALYGVHEQSAAWLCEEVRGEVAERLEELGISIDETHSARARSAIAHARGLPNLRRLGVARPYQANDVAEDVENVRFVFESALWQRIQRFTSSVKEGRDVFPWASAVREHPGSLAELVILVGEFNNDLRRPSGWRLWLSPDKEGRFALRAEWVTDGKENAEVARIGTIAEALQAIPKDWIRGVSITPSPYVRPTEDERRWFLRFLP